MGSIPRESARAIRARTALQAVLVGALALYVVHATLGLGGPSLDDLFSTWVHNGLMLAAAAICIWRAAVSPRRTGERAAWACLSVALASYAGGEISWALMYAEMEEAPYPSISDAFWLLFYPASYLGLALLFRARVRHFDASLWLDGLIGALAIAGIGAAFVFPVVVAETDGNVAAVATTLAYPLGDLLLLGFVVGVFALMAWRPDRAWAMIGAGLAVNAVADVIYTYQSATGTFVEGSLEDSLFPTAALILGFAAFQPGVRARVRIEGWRMLAFPAVFSLTGFGLTAYALFVGVSRPAEACALATLLLVLLRLGLTLGEHLRMIERVRSDSVTDALTGLANRRRLMEELPAELAAATPRRPRTLAVFDLDGFKGYNDTFGHPTGDALLSRLGRNLSRAVDPWGRVYRLGGDEFCAILTVEEHESDGVVAAVAGALAERGEGFEIRCSHGSVLIPFETADPDEAMQLADERMYRQKQRRPASPARQARDALLGLLREREPELLAHTSDVAELAGRVGRRLGMRSDELDEVARAAELHDIGKMALPDAIVGKRGPLDEEEREFMEAHTLIGERILAAAPALRPVAGLVRSTHERFDGSGYPDGLVGGEIPLGARIIAVCDAYDAMITDRAYRTAISPEAARAELARDAGRQFDPAVVEAFLTEVAFDVAPAPAPPPATPPTTPSAPRRAPTA